MDRRTFLVGLGKFAGAALVVPTLPTIFDMGRSSTGLVLEPEPLAVFDWGRYLPYVTNGIMSPSAVLDAYGAWLKSDREWMAGTGPVALKSETILEWELVDPLTVYPRWQDGRLVEAHT